MTLAEFISDDASETPSLTVVNRESPRPLYRLLTDLFDERSVTVRETTSDRSDRSDAIVLKRSSTSGDDTETIVSPFDQITDELLLVNADIYTTGTRGLEAVETPNVIAQLDEVSFRVDGTVASKQKLVLIEISRYIEAKAWMADEGRLHTGFQHLSRIGDEKGTRRVYERIGLESSVDTHVYGHPDASPSLPNVTVHGVETDEIRRSWFVAYESLDGEDAAALVAHRTGPAAWNALWSYDPTKVADLVAYLERKYGR